ncbi:Kunitz-type protease inhibitor 2 like protein [Argiope bruennichi]|uniref:Kunitz-type protease inhibitor 2 like protein n=1 Tax=Argiope bruennichi TaxID=94029 RepID=A0A8T0E1C8_ARGBR|nr:Kunitz-type protease inhibitor 2 like protein [Argiope bruennichi]
MKLFLGFLLLVVVHARQERCRENQHFDSCGTACPLTCDNHFFPEEPCERICIPGCQCDEGFVLTKTGSCVRPEDCPVVTGSAEKNCIEAPVTGQCRALFYNWYFDQETGTCREFVYGGCGGNGNRYWSEEECQKNCGGVKHCDENEHFESCGTACPLTCDNHEDPPEFCVLMCVRGCHCDEGFVRSRQGRCVRPQEC